MINFNYKKGFTLVEMLVAISILSLSILAAFTAVSSNIKNSKFSEDKIVASYLASEAIEYIKNVRDENAIRNIQGISTNTPVNWLRDISDTISDPCYNRSCVIDSIANTISPCTSNHASCPFLRQHYSKIYGYDNSWTVTKFKRSVIVSSLSSNEAIITVTVSWVASDGSTKSYTLSEIIRNWQ